MADTPVGSFSNTLHTSGVITFRGVALAACLPIKPPASGTAVSTLRRSTQTFASGLPAVAQGPAAASAVIPQIQFLRG